MKKILKNKVGIITGLSFFFFVFFLSLFPSQTELVMPGNVSQVGRYLSIEEKAEDENNFYSTAVYVIRKPSYLISSLIELSSKVESYNINKKLNISNKENNIMGDLDHKDSISNSIINAYTLASEKDPSIKVDYKINKITIYFSPSHLRTKLPIGKEFTKINNTLITKEVYNNIKSYFKNTVSLSNDNETVVLSNSEIKSSLLNNGMPFIAKPNIIINEDTISPKVKIKETNTRGPSAGLIQTISLYYSLLNLENNKKIAGTGTISLDGEIGPIGGIIQKIHTVNKKKMEYFIIPYENYTKNQTEIDKLQKKIKTKIIVVKSFLDAINKISEIGD